MSGGIIARFFGVWISGFMECINMRINRTIDLSVYGQLIPIQFVGPAAPFFTVAAVIRPEDIVFIIIPPIFEYFFTAILLTVPKMLFPIQNPLF